MKKLKLITLFVISLFLLQSCDKDSQDISILNKKKPSKTDWNLTEWTNGVLDPCKQVCLVAGQHMYVGTVDIAESNGDLYVTYNITESGVYLEEVHLDIFSSLEDFRDARKLSNGGAIPGKFEYKKSFSSGDMVTTHTVKIPKDYVDYIGGDCVFVASHAALSNGETAWGGLCDSSTGNVTDLDDAKQFPGANWSVYFEFCLDECEESIDFTYAWEDLQNVDNDGDYNDLVIQADVIKSATELKMTFLASARGAAYDHEFKIKIPMQGIDGIFGEESVSNDGTFYYITVFASTKAKLPAEGISPYPFAANTVETDDTCTPIGTAELTLTINGAFIFDLSKPYEPFITVYPSGTAGVGSNYDLYIWEVSARPGLDIWSDGVNDFPNGIIIPRDWEWPLETEIITGPYPDFNPIATWNPNWADNLDDDTLVFDCSI